MIVCGIKDSFGVVSLLQKDHGTFSQTGFRLIQVRGVRYDYI